MDETLVKISASPHIRDKHSTTSIMGDVLISLIPAAIFGIYNFGIRAYILIMVCMISCMVFEALTQRVFKKRVTVRDLSAAVTGLLLALNLPPELPVWMAILGCAFAIIVVKQMFGGIGQNFMNPALAARCFLLMSFVGPMTQFTYDGITTATALSAVKNGGSYDLLSMFLGTEAGTIGETSVVALLIGAAYLLIKKVIRPHIPFAYILTFAVCVFLYALTAGHMNLTDSLYFLGAELCGGGLILGAFFMATDYATSPITNRGKLLYGVLLGVLTFVLRMFGSSAEGVSYAIIISNLLVPLIEMITKPKAFGEGYESKPLSENMGFLSKDTDTQEGDVAAKKETTGKVVAIICIIGAAAGLALGFVYNITKGPIAETAEKNKQASYQTVFPDGAAFLEAEDIDLDEANARAKELGASGADLDEILYAQDAEENLLGYVVIVTTHEGYAGDIQMALGIDTTGTITGLTMLSIGETTGLGMEARDNPDFAAQYVGKQIDSFTVVKNSAEADNEIVAISGATITSNAVTGAVNTALYYINDMLGGAGNE
jgi:RnfABCDGE-type electron transport complex G subunit